MSRKILLIDDEKDIQMLVKMSLEFMSEDRVIVASNGLEGIEMAKMEHPDVILLDVMMPRLDGFETYRRLQSNTETEGIPVVFLTAKAESKDIEQGLKMGAAAYITKPFDGMTLKDELEKILANTNA